MTITEKDILNLTKRKKIYTLLLKNPGLYLREISRKLNIPKTTTNYHLRYLERKNLIKSEIKGKYTRYYAGNDIGLIEKNILKHLRNDISRRILFLTFIYNEMYVEEIGMALDIPITTVIYHLKKLRKCELLSSYRYKRRITYFITNRNYVYDLFIKYENSLTDDPIYSSFLFYINNYRFDKRLPVKNTHNRYDTFDSICEKFFDIFPVPFMC